MINPVSKSSKAKLSLDVELVRSYMRQHQIKDKYVSQGAPVYMTAVLEYVSAEILELSGSSSGEISVEDMKKAIFEDQELFKLFPQIFAFGDETLYPSTSCIVNDDDFALNENLCKDHILDLMKSTYLKANSDDVVNLLFDYVKEVHSKMIDGRPSDLIAEGLSGLLPFNMDSTALEIVSSKFNTNSTKIKECQIMHYMLKYAVKLILIKAHDFISKEKFIEKYRRIGDHEYVIDESNDNFTTIISDKIMSACIQCMTMSGSTFNTMQPIDDSTLISAMENLSTNSNRRIESKFGDFMAMEFDLVIGAMKVITERDLGKEEVATSNLAKDSIKKQRYIYRDNDLNSFENLVREYGQQFRYNLRYSAGVFKLLKQSIDLLLRLVIENGQRIAMINNTADVCSDDIKKAVLLLNLDCDYETDTMDTDVSELFERNELTNTLTVDAKLELKGIATSMLTSIIEAAVHYSEYKRRKTINVEDIVTALASIQVFEFAFKKQNSREVTPSTVLMTLAANGLMKYYIVIVKNSSITLKNIALDVLDAPRNIKLKVLKLFRERPHFPHHSSIHQACSTPYSNAEANSSPSIASEHHEPHPFCIGGCGSRRLAKALEEAKRHLVDPQNQQESQFIICMTNTPCFAKAIIPLHESSSVLIQPLRPSPHDPALLTLWDGHIWLAKTDKLHSIKMKQEPGGWKIIVTPKVLEFIDLLRSKGGIFSMPMTLNAAVAIQQQTGNVDWDMVSLESSDFDDASNADSILFPTNNSQINSGGIASLQQAEKNNFQLSDSFIDDSKSREPSASLTEAKLQDLPTDPLEFCKNENIRRRQYAEADLPLELLSSPHFELYNVYENLDLFCHQELSPDVIENLICKSMRDKLIKKQCIVTKSEFKERWALMTQGVFDSVDMSSCLVAGGSVLSCMMGDDVTLSKSDIDIFVYGMNMEEANLKVLSVIEKVCENRKKIAHSMNEAEPTSIIARSPHAVTLLGCDTFRPIQFVLRLYRTPTEVLLCFDVDSCCVGYDISKDSVLANHRAWRAIVSRVNRVDLSRRSPTYESRLIKYSKRGFGVYLDQLRKSDIDVLKVKVGLLSGLGTSGIMKLIEADLAVQAEQIAPEEISVGPYKCINRSNYSMQMKSEGIWELADVYGGSLGPNFDCFNIIDDSNEVDDGSDNAKKEAKLDVRDKNYQVAVTNFKTSEELMQILSNLKFLISNPGQQGLFTGSFEPLVTSSDDFYQEHLWRRGSNSQDGSFIQWFYSGVRLANKLSSHQVDDDAVLDKFVIKKNSYDSSAAKLIKLPHTETVISIPGVVASSCSVLAASSSNLLIVLRQVLGNMKITNKARLLLQDLLASLLSKLQYRAVTLKQMSKMKILGPQEVCNSVRLIFPNQLSSLAVAEGTRHVIYYCS